MLSVFPAVKGFVYLVLSWLFNFWDSFNMPKAPQRYVGTIWFGCGVLVTGHWLAFQLYMLPDKVCWREREDIFVLVTVLLGLRRSGTHWTLGLEMNWIWFLHVLGCILGGCMLVHDQLLGRLCNRKDA